MALKMIEGFSFVLDATEGGPTYKFPYTSYLSSLAHTGVNDVIKSTGLGIPNRYNVGLQKPQYFAHLRHQREEVGFLDSRHFYPEKTWVVGEAVYFSGLMQSPSPSSLLWSFYSPSGLQCRVGVDGGGKVYATTGSGAWLGSSTLAMRPSGWYYVESKVFVDDTYGRIEVRVNEFPWLKLTNVDTRGNTLREDVDLVRFHVPKNFYIRDIYACDGSGAVNSDFIGDCIIEQMAPVMTGFHVLGWLTSDGSANSNKPNLIDENIVTTYANDYVYASSVLNAAGTFYTRPRDTFYVQRVTATGFYSIVAVDMQAHTKDMNSGLLTYAQFVTCSTILPDTGNSIITANKKWEMSNQDYSHQLDYTFGYDSNSLRSLTPLMVDNPGAHQILTVNRTMNESPNPPWSTGNLYLTQFGFWIT